MPAALAAIPHQPSGGDGGARRRRGAMGWGFPRNTVSPRADARRRTRGGRRPTPADRPPLQPPPARGLAPGSPSAPGIRVRPCSSTPAPGPPRPACAASLMLMPCPRLPPAAGLRANGRMRIAIRDGGHQPRRVAPPPPVEHRPRALRHQPAGTWLADGPAATGRGPNVAGGGIYCELVTRAGRAPHNAPRPRGTAPTCAAAPTCIPCRLQNRARQGRRVELDAEHTRNAHGKLASCRLIGMALAGGACAPDHEGDVAAARSPGAGSATSSASVSLAALVRRRRQRPLGNARVGVRRLSCDRAAAAGGDG